jgi:hypothetical protein
MPAPRHGEKRVRLTEGIMNSRQLTNAEGNLSRALTWLGIIAMFAFFWVSVGGLALRLLIQRG